MDAPKLVEPLVKWSHEPARPRDVPQSLSKGILLATAAPTGPVYLSLPLDDWDHDADISALGFLRSRVVDGNPVVGEVALGRLRERLVAAANPILVVGPGIDTTVGWDGAVRLAERLALPVLVAPSPSRCPFPTRHPCFRGILPAGIPTVASHFEGHDLVVAFGAPIFLYHEFIEGDYLPKGTELWAITADPDEAARAPVGHLLIGDPADAVKRLADTMPSAERRRLAAREPLPPADTTGPAFTEEAILDAVNAAKTESTVIAHEWTSAQLTFDRLEFTRPGSLYFSASGGLGWGLPAAIGLQLGDPSRRVVALLGDGAVHYSVSGLGAGRTGGCVVGRRAGAEQLGFAGGSEQGSGGGFDPGADGQPHPGEVQVEVAHGDGAVVAVAEEHAAGGVVPVAAEADQRGEAAALAQHRAVVSQFALGEVYSAEQAELVELDEVQLPAEAAGLEVVGLAGGHDLMQVGVHMLARRLGGQRAEIVKIGAGRDSGAIDPRDLPPPRCRGAPLLHSVRPRGVRRRRRGDRRSPARRPLFAGSVRHVLCRRHRPTLARVIVYRLSRERTPLGARRQAGRGRTHAPLSAVLNRERPARPIAWGTPVPPRTMTALRTWHAERSCGRLVVAPSLLTLLQRRFAAGACATPGPLEAAG